MAENVPIVYVRGFAGSTSGINNQVDDPFYGFNLGSTHVRVGGRGDPIFYQFESPLLRLMIDHDYKLFVRGGQLAWLAGGVVVVEFLFRYPGIGQALIDAVSKRDVAVVQAITMIIAALYIVVNLLADVIGILANPKLRTEAVR